METELTPRPRSWVRSTYAFENPGKTFEEVVLKEFGPDLFPPTPQRRLFEKECREVFDRERES
jgi:hypothetical protein